MVNLVPTKETKVNVQAQRQDYPNNPFRASPKRLCRSGSQEPATRFEKHSHLSQPKTSFMHWDMPMCIV